MSQTSTNKNLIFIIAVLLLTNIAVLVYFLAFKKHPDGPRKMDGRNGGLTELLKSEVGFNDSQVEQYRQMREKQREKIRPMFDEMRKAKDSLFRLMSKPEVSDSLISQAANAIAEKQKQLDLSTFSHFKNVRSLCISSEQQVKYDSAILKMFRKMGKPSRRGEQGKEKDKDKPAQ